MNFSGTPLKDDSPGEARRMRLASSRFDSRGPNENSASMGGSPCETIPAYENYISASVIAVADAVISYC